MIRTLIAAACIAGDEYSIVDIACWPWVKPYENQGQDIRDFPNLARWFEEIGERPAVQRGVEVLADLRSSGRSGQGFDERAREVLFGSTQFRKR